MLRCNQPARKNQLSPVADAGSDNRLGTTLQAFGMQLTFRAASGLESERRQIQSE